MILTVRLSLTVLGGAIALFGQSAREAPVGLVLAASSGKLLRANTSLELTAKVGDILFPGDSLRGAGSALSFIDCPENSALTLSPDGVAVFEASRCG